MSVGEECDAFLEDMGGMKVSRHGIVLHKLTCFVLVSSVNLQFRYSFRRPMPGNELGSEWSLC